MPQNETQAQNILSILQIALAAEPAVLQAITTFMQKTQGKSVEEIIAATDAIWDSVAATAKKEIGQ